MRRTETFDVGDRPRIEVHLPSGAVEVRAGPIGRIEILIDAAEPDDVTVTQVGDTVTVRQTSRWGFRNRAIRVAAAVPASAEVEVTTASGDVRTTGPLGVVRLRTASGRLDVDTVDRLELTSSSGDAHVGTVAGDCTLNTVSGDAVLRRVGGRLTGTLVSGDLRAATVVGDLRVGTTSGDVRVDRCDGSDVSLKSVSGDVEIGLPSGIRVDADLSTMSGRARLPEADRGATPAGPRREVRLAVRSVSGDITIRRA